MPSADVIITNAKVFTSDETHPQAEAMAVKGNRILYVGTNEGVQSFKDKSTRVIDGQGHTLTAGFIDSHVHLLWGSTWMGNAQLQEVKTKEDLKKILLDYASENRTNPCVVGRRGRMASAWRRARSMPKMERVFHWSCRDIQLLSRSNAQSNTSSRTSRQ